MTSPRMSAGKSQSAYVSAKSANVRIAKNTKGSTKLSKSGAEIDNNEPG